MQASPNLINRRYFIFLFPLFYVIHGYLLNFPSVSLTDALLLVAQYEAALVILLAVLYLLFRSWDKAIWMGFFLFCIQFFFGPLQDGIRNSLPHSFLSKYSFLLSLLLVITIIVFFRIRSWKANKTNAARYLNILLVLLIAVDLVLVISKAAQKEKEDQPSIRSCASCPKPNIYLIVADEYAGRTELKELFSFDNTPFEDSLRQRNFTVINHTRSNYNYTPYSMASLLDMNYLQGISDKANERDNRTIAYKAINHNQLVKSLSALGYDFVNLSIFDFAGRNTQFNTNEFYATGTKLITDQTFTGRLYRDLSYHLVTTLAWENARTSYRNKLEHTLKNQLQATTEEAGKRTAKPRFIYTHLIMPHYPYLFDKNGKQQGWDQMLYGKGEAYLGFLQYANGQFLSLADAIEKNDNTHPIIILLSDHGFTKYESEKDPAYNFHNIIHIYSGDQKGWPDSLSNVNLFRVLLNTKFGQNLPLLKDSTIFLQEY